MYVFIEREIDRQTYIEKYIVLTQVTGCSL